MRKFLFISSLLFIIIFTWGIMLPRNRMVVPEFTQVVVNPLIPIQQKPLYIENPSWVFPQNIEHYVTVTIYHAVSSQTDNTPNILADGTRIDISKAGKYRYCALSRNLLERWNGPYAYGDTIFLEGAGKFSGPWVVKDTMNKRYTNRIDLLVDVGTRPYKFEVAIIRKVM